MQYRPAQRLFSGASKGFDPLKEIRRAAAERWCAAVNAHGGFGAWAYRVVEKPEQVRAVLDSSGA